MNKEEKWEVIVKDTRKKQENQKREKLEGLSKN